LLNKISNDKIMKTFCSILVAFAACIIAADAATVTLTDALALTSQAAGATSNTATYTFQTDVALATGTTFVIAMPNFAGTSPTVTVGTCVNGGTAPTFTIDDSGTGATYKVTLTTATTAIVVTTDCTVTIGALTNPASSGAPAYTVAVTDGTVGTQAATVPDTVSGASINIAITGGATQTIEKGAAVTVTNLATGNHLCWTAATSATAVTACLAANTATDAGTTGCGAVNNAAPVWTTLTNDDVSLIECTGTTIVGTAIATVLTEANIAITGGAAQDLVAGAALAVTELGSGRHLCWTAAATATAITACTAAATANDAGTSGCGAADDASLVWTTVAGTHVSIIQCQGTTVVGSAVATVLTEQIVVASQNITAGSIVTVAGLTTGNHLCWTAGTVAGSATCAAAGIAADLGVTGCGAADDNTIAWTTTSKDYIAIRECTGTNTNVGAEVDLVLGVTTTAAPTPTTTVSGASSEAAWSTMLTVFAIAMAAFSTL
jgi:hypothetical protein